MVLSCVLASSCIIKNGKEILRNFKNNHIQKDSLLRLDGYYYHYFEKKIINHNINGKYIHIYLLYKDGTLHNTGTFSAFSDNKYLLEENTEENCHKKFLGMYKRYVNDDYIRTKGWGQYRVIEDTLHLKYFTFGPDHINLSLVESKGFIENDSTFTLKETKALGWEESSTEERIYKFRKLNEAKPDSTNWTQDL